MQPSHDDRRPDSFAEVEDLVRRFGPEPTDLQLDAIKRRALMQASRATTRKGQFMRSKLVTLLLAAGLTVTGGTAGVIAAGGPDGDKGRSAAKSQYQDGKQKCNAGNGNGNEGCDPGNSAPQNRGGDEIGATPGKGGSTPNPGGNNVPADD